MNINIAEINSAAIESLRFEAVGARYDDLEATGTLVVTFKSGGSYAYHAVKVSTMREVLSAESIGSAIARTIRPAHSFTKIAGGEVGAPKDSSVVA